MPEPIFKIGDIVTLKSGSVKMTINALKHNRPLSGTPYFNGFVTCKWFSDGKLNESEFHQDALDLG
ncbi:DUF2158 domain-containing protein [Flavobacterium sp. CAU 1735]|uniref:YodC family protein n=1 Tax=Flavobacterium sp. CAU 1735 TaxID=3140361 RepID=UPI003260AA02